MSIQPEDPALDLKAMRRAATEFAQKNLAVCAAELLCWHDTAILPDGKVRELAGLCAAWAGPESALSTAERIIEYEALRQCAGA